MSGSKGDIDPLYCTLHMTMLTSFPGINISSALPMPTMYIHICIYPSLYICNCIYLLMIYRILSEEEPEQELVHNLYPIFRHVLESRPIMATLGWLDSATPLKIQKEGNLAVMAPSVTGGGEETFYISACPC